MRRFLLILAVLLTLTLSGCGQAQYTVSDKDTVYHSDTSSEDCYLCGEGGEPLYWGQDNLALISFNTFEIKPIEINRYDRLSGQLIEEPAGFISFGGSGSQNGGFSANMMLEPDRGYATGSLYFYNDESLDVDKASSFLCSDCLNRILPQELEQCFGVGAIHLATKEIHVFDEHVTGFSLGDFYVDCNLIEEPGRSSRWLDFLAFYCPERYEKKF